MQNESYWTISIRVKSIKSKIAWVREPNDLMTIYLCIVILLSFLTWSQASFQCFSNAFHLNFKALNSCLLPSFPISSLSLFAHRYLLVSSNFLHSGLHIPNSDPLLTFLPYLEFTLFIFQLCQPPPFLQNIAKLPPLPQSHQPDRCLLLYSHVCGLLGEHLQKVEQCFPTRIPMFKPQNSPLHWVPWQRKVKVAEN